MGKKRSKRRIKAWFPLLGPCEVDPSRPQIPELPKSPIDDIRRAVGQEPPPPEWLDHLDRLRDRADAGIEVTCID
jgi:hypothetical protein